MSSYILLEVEIHGLDEIPETVVKRVRAALTDVFWTAFESDLVIDVIEHSGARCDKCTSLGGHELG